MKKKVNLYLCIEKRNNNMVKPHDLLVLVGSHTLLHFHLQPINLVVFKESSGGLNPQGCIILRWASHLDAFSGYPFRT